jgi:AcrR family transcriptional regulator
MGRKAHFTNKKFIDAAIEIISKDGPSSLTIATLAKRINAPVGSVYHRFPSRDALLSELWLNIIESFQNEFLEKLQTDGLQATLGCLQWVRQHPNESRIMLLYRINDLTSGKWPPDLQKRAGRLAKELHEGIAAFTKRQFRRITKENTDRAIFAIHDAPIGIIRRYLRDNKVPPESVNDLIRETYKAVIEKNKMTSG